MLLERPLLFTTSRTFFGQNDNAFNYLKQRSALNYNQMNGALFQNILHPVEIHLFFCKHWFRVNITIIIRINNIEQYLWTGLRSVLNELFKTF